MNENDALKKCITHILQRHIAAKIGNALFYLKDFQGALTDVSKAIEINPRAFIPIIFEDLLKLT